MVSGYVRVSTKQQADSGAGMAVQRAAICLVCQQNEWELGHIYEDAGASAKALTGRPALAAALKALKAGGASALVVSKLDRLARSVHDFAGLVRLAEKQGWGIVALDLGVDMTTPTGRRVGAKDHQRLYDRGARSTEAGWRSTGMPSAA